MVSLMRMMIGRTMIRATNRTDCDGNRFAITFEKMYKFDKLLLKYMTEIVDMNNFPDINFRFVSEIVEHFTDECFS